MNSSARNLCQHERAGCKENQTETSAHSQSPSFVFFENYARAESSTFSGGTASGTGRVARDATGAVVFGEVGERPAEPTLEVSACTASYSARPPGHGST